VTVLAQKAGAMAEVVDMAVAVVVDTPIAAGPEGVLRTGAVAVTGTSELEMMLAAGAGGLTTRHPT
jgi:hypothetical protein